jgi:hypothetical protein
MGWTSAPSWSSRKDIIREVLSPSHNTYPNGTQGVCLDSCYKGGPFSGRLWVLYEKRKTDGSSYRFIILYLLQFLKHDRGWAYKDVTEHMGPCEVDCPLNFLEQAPLDQILGDQPSELSMNWAMEWREKVKNYHANKVTLSSIEVGKTYVLNFCKIPHITVTSKRPLKGEYQGITYRLPKKLIGKVLETP